MSEIKMLDPNIGKVLWQPSTPGAERVIVNTATDVDTLVTKINEIIYKVNKLDAQATE